MTPGQRRRPSDESDTYDGPVIAARTREAGKGWIWVANGTRSPTEVFRAPSPIGALRSAYVALPQVDEAMADAFVDELRSGSWMEEDETWAEDDSDDESVVETITTGPPANIDEHIGVEIRILGPVEVVGWSQAPERAVVTELACYLALHPGRIVPGDELRAVEGVEVGGVQLGDFDPAESGNDSLVDGRPVTDHRRGRSPQGLQVEHPLLQQVRHRAALGGLEAAVDLGGQLIGCLLGSPLTARDGPVDVAVPARTWVAASRNPHLPSVWGRLTDASGHGPSLPRPGGIMA